jgi:hypothetical protein
MSEKDMNQRFRVARKMELVSESWHLAGKELGRFLRENGICSVELKSWREQMSDGLKNGKPIIRNEKRILENRIEALEEELRQAKVVIELQKKVQGLFAEKEAKSTALKSAKKSAK